LGRIRIFVRKHAKVVNLALCTGWPQVCESMSTEPRLDYLPVD